MAWIGYELDGSESALHTVEVPSATSEFDGFAGTAAACVDGNWAVMGWQAGGGGTPWVKFDLGSSKGLVAFKIKGDGVPSLWGSDNDADWTSIPLAAGVPGMGTATASQMIYEFASTETYRYWRFHTATWRSIFEIELYSTYAPAGLRMWGMNPYTGNEVHQAFDDNTTTTYYADGSSGHQVGFMLLEAEVLGELTVRTKYTGTFNLDYSDDGASWLTSDSGVACTDDVDTIFNPSETGAHQFWRVPLGTWKEIREVSPSTGAVSSGGQGDDGVVPQVMPTAQSWRIGLDKRQRMYRAQFWK